MLLLFTLVSNFTCTKLIKLFPPIHNAASKMCYRTCTLSPPPPPPPPQHTHIHYAASKMCYCTCTLSPPPPPPPNTDTLCSIKNVLSYMYFVSLPPPPPHTHTLCSIKSACPCYTTQLWGGTKGSAFSDLPTDQPCIGDITKIRIRHGDAIDAIQITYKLYNGKTLTAPKHGWDGGEPEEIVLEEGEKIIGVYGFNDSFVRTGDPYIHNIVRQLTFVSLKKTNLPAIYGPYGLVQTKNQVNDGLGHTFVIMGYIDSIFGRSGEYIDAIGFNYEPWDCLDV